MAKIWEKLGFNAKRKDETAKQEINTTSPVSSVTNENIESKQNFEKQKDNSLEEFKEAIDLAKTVEEMDAVARKTPRDSEAERVASQKLDTLLKERVNTIEDPEELQNLSNKLYGTSEILIRRSDDLLKNELESADTIEKLHDLYLKSIPTSWTRTRLREKTEGILSESIMVERDQSKLKDIIENVNQNGSSEKIEYLKNVAIRKLAVFIMDDVNASEGDVEKLQKIYDETPSYTKIKDTIKGKLETALGDKIKSQS